MSADEPAAIEEVRHSFKVEIVNLKTPQMIDFDAVLGLDSSGVEIARFRVSDVCKREVDAVNSGTRSCHWSKSEERHDGGVTHDRYTARSLPDTRGAKPNIAFLEVGKIGIEIPEQEYRDRGYEPDFEKKAGKDQ